ncbi:MAG TPA: hypothetical protein VMS78_04785 [Rhizomicrobium sp.]|nr:hypothetical protein [Rhizomicrobium sp.]
MIGQKGIYFILSKLMLSLTGGFAAGVSMVYIFWQVFRSRM